MKNYFFVLTLAFVSIFNQAFTTPVEKLAECETDTVFISEVALNKKVARVEADLINNKWVNKDVVFIFSELGMLTTTTRSGDDRISEERAIWRVAVQGGQLVLIITNTSTDEYTVYNIKETPEGIVLMDGTLNKELALAILK